MQLLFSILMDDRAISSDQVSSISTLRHST